MQINKQISNNLSKKTYMTTLNVWFNNRKYSSAHKQIREKNNIIISILGENMVNEVHQYILDKLP